MDQTKVIADLCAVIDRMNAIIQAQATELAQHGAVDHAGCHLEVVPVGDGVVGFIDALCQKAGEKLGLLGIQADGGRLVELGRLFLFVCL